MKVKTILKIAALGAAFLTGCSVDGADESIGSNPAIGSNPISERDSVTAATLDSVTSQEEFDNIYNKLSDTQIEFEYNYEILYYGYLFAHSDSLKPEGAAWYYQLGNRSNYVGFGKKAYPKQANNIESDFLDIYFMYAMMNDGYTYYMDPSTILYDNFLDLFNAREESYDAGIGVSLLEGEDTILVVDQIMTTSAADGSGIKIGDTIVSVLGTTVNNVEAFEKLTTGSVGDTITITTVETVEGERVEKDYALVISKYFIPSVTYKIIDSVAVISISEFANENTPSDSGTYGEFITALKATENTKATIIDLRGNPGGDENQCVSISSEFLGKNDIVNIHYEAGADTTTGMPTVVADTLITTEDGLANNRYVVFLADTASASCAEYTISSVTASKPSPVIGMLTYGKAIGYSIVPTYLKGVSMFTSIILYTKNKETYHMKGIAPDIELDDYDQMLDTALAIAKEGSMKRTAGFGTEILDQYKKPVLSKKSIASEKIPTTADLGMYRFQDEKNFGKVKHTR